jgi:hypothetical protein
MLVVPAIIHEKRLERLEQQLCGIFDAESAVTLLAQDSSQFLQNQIGASNFFATQHAAFELAGQQRTSSWRKLAQKLPQPFDGRFGARHSRSIRIQAFWLDTAGGVKALLSVIRR